MIDPIKQVKDVRMKKHTQIFSISLAALAAVALLFACSTGTGGGDDGPKSTTPHAITVTPTGATGSEAVTASVTDASEGTTITLTATLGSGRRVTLSVDGVTITPSTISTSNGTVTFTMPGNSIAVMATFSYTPVHDPGYIEEHTANTKTFKMCYVPSGGTFTMGQHVYSTAKTVTLTKNFWMGETEVTQGLLEAVWVSILGRPSFGVTTGIGDNLPAYDIDWYQSVAFCNMLTVADEDIPDSEQVYYSDDQLTTEYTETDAALEKPVYTDFGKKGYRLPTSAEWEYAARYIDGETWIGGDHVSGDADYACYILSTGLKSGSPLASDERISEYAWWGGNNGGALDPDFGVKEVGIKQANSLGLRDMSGNVEEWCYDWFEPYSGGSTIDPEGPDSGEYRIYRGGFWSGHAGYMRSASRDRFFPSHLSSSRGFRFCRTAE